MSDDSGIINPNWLNYLAQLEADIATATAAAAAGTAQTAAVTALTAQVAALEARIAELSPGGSQVQPLSIMDAHVADVAQIAYRKLDLNGKIVSADLVSVEWGKVTGRPTTLDGYGITDAVKLMTKIDTGDPAGVEGLAVINTFDNTFKVYADGAWRTLASGW